MPAVSVVIPTYNRAHCIGQAVSSVLSQSFSDFELLISDDGSIDGTERLVTNIDDSRVKFLAFETNSGAAAARNRAVAASKSPLLAFLDSDDIWLPNKLEAHLFWMQDRTDLQASFTDYQFLRENNGKVSVRKPSADQSDWAWDLLLYCRAAAGSTLLAQRTAFEVFGLFDENLKRFEDWDWMFRLAFENKLGKAPIVGSQISRRGHFPWRELEAPYDQIIQRWNPTAHGVYGNKAYKRLKAGRSLQKAVSALSEGHKLETFFNLVSGFVQSPLAITKFCYSRFNSL